MSSIFISHSSKDNTFAKTFKNWLGSEGLGYQSIFLDFDPELGIEAGTDWKQALYDRLYRCQAVVVLLSEHWLSSKWCFAEAVQARGAGKQLIFAKIAECTPDSTFSDLQHVDLTGDQISIDEGYEIIRLALSKTFDWTGERAPYPGLPAFQAEDAAIFFGREDEVRESVELLEQLHRNQPNADRFLLILGASGAGKSSLLRAGVLPQLARESSNWLVIPPFVPGADSFGSLASALSQAFTDFGETRSIMSLRQMLTIEDSGAESLFGLLADLSVISPSNNHEAKIIIAIDQVDDLTVPGQDIHQFWRCIRETLALGNGRVLAVGTLRSDLLGSFQVHPGVAPTTLNDSETLHYKTITLGPLPHDRFRQIIIGPAQRAGLEIEPELVEQMVEDASSSDALPLLAFVLNRMWMDTHIRSDMRFDLHEYNSLGGIDSAVQRAADAAQAQIRLQYENTKAADTALQTLFIPGLVESKGSGVTTRRAAKLGELPANAEALLLPFDKARLITIDGNLDVNGNEVKWVRVTHEAMLRNWPTLARWIEIDSSKLAIFSELRRDSEDWADNEYVEVRLNHRDSRLTVAENVLREPRFLRMSESSSVSDYLLACSNRQTEIQKQQRQFEEQQQSDYMRRIEDAKRFAEQQKTVAHRTKVGLIVSAILMFAATGFAIYADQQKREANRAVQISEDAKSNAESATKIAKQRLVETGLTALRADAEQNFSRASLNTLLVSKTQKLAEREDKKSYIARLEKNAEIFLTRGQELLERAFKISAMEPEEQAKAILPSASMGLQHPIFSITALRAKHGVSLLIEHGTANSSQLILYGGGPSGTYKQTLKPALVADARKKGLKRPKIDLIVVPEQDAQTLDGVDDLFSEVSLNREDPKHFDLEIGGYWHNHFAPMTGEGIINLSNITGNSFRDRSAISARKLQIPVNEPFDYFITSTEAGPARVTLPSGMSITVLGPKPSDLEKLQKHWKRKIAKRYDGPSVSLLEQIGGFVKGYSSADIELIRSPDIEGVGSGRDRSVTNLSSILLLLEFEGKRVLLCGDATDTQITRGLMSAGLLQPGGHINLDAMLVPHYGSDRNVSLEFFRQVRADNYIILGNGQHTNPEPATLRWLLEARKEDLRPFSIYLSYSIDEIGRHRDYQKRNDVLLDLRKVQGNIRNTIETGEMQGIFSPDEGELGVVLSLLGGSG